MATTVRDEFINVSDGWVGVVQLGIHGEPRGAAVEPRGNVWLSEEEQILTANAPRRDEDNPFVNGCLELRTRGVEIKSRRPYGEVPKPTVEEEETGAAPAPEGEPEKGSLAPGEEVATPEAPKARMRPRARAGA